MGAVGGDGVVASVGNWGGGGGGGGQLLNCTLLEGSLGMIMDSE